MKKRCEICGKIYDPRLHGCESGSITVGLPGDIDGKTHRIHSGYSTCVDCALKMKGFVDKLLEGDNDEDRETDVPKKTGHWSLLYSPIEDLSLVKCSNCGFTITEKGRVNTFMHEECPSCKAKMEVRVDDYSL